MNDKILFMILNDEIKFNTNPNKDHHEWFIELGGKEEDYEKIIRGFIVKEMILFFKENFNYDTEVINTAKKCGLLIRKQLGRPYLKVCCGVNFGQNGSWEPIIVLTDAELSEANIDVEKEQRELLRQVEERKREEEIKSRKTNTIVDFKNDYENTDFIKYATIFNLIILLSIVISKILLILNKTIILENNIWMQLLVIAQIIFSIITLLGYRMKKQNAKYFGVATSIASFFFFDIIDIIIGAFNLFFTVDYKYIISFMELVNSIINKIKRIIKKIKDSKKPMMKQSISNSKNVKRR